MLHFALVIYKNPDIIALRIASKFEKVIESNIKLVSTNFRS